MGALGAGERVGRPRVPSPAFLYTLCIPPSPVFLAVGAWPHPGPREAQNLPRTFPEPGAKGDPSRYKNGGQQQPHS